MPWTTLDIEPTRDPRAVRQAYARALKSRTHEGDARYFEELRGAYERALAICAEADRSDPSPHTAPAQATPESEAPAATPGPDGNADAAAVEFGYEPIRPEEFDALNHALARLADGMRSGSDDDMTQAWDALCGHPLLDRLDIRERASEIVADMVATHWPRSTPVWALAEKHFAWEPPTQTDRSLLAGPLRWTYDRLQSENARWDRLWQAYEKVVPHPDELLAWRGPGWKKALRFLAHRNARCVMRRFLDDVSTLGLDDQFGERTAALQWWKAAFARPLPTRRHAVPVILSLTGISAAGSDPHFWKVIVLFLGIAVAWYAIAVTWNRFEVGRRLNALLDGPRLFFGPPALAAAGVLACGFAMPIDRAWLSMLGVTATALSASWAWLRSAKTNPFQYMDDVHLLRFMVVYLLVTVGFAEVLRLPPAATPEFPLRYAFGLSLAHWILYSGGRTLGAWESRFQGLAEIRLERLVVVLAPALVVAQLAATTMFPPARIVVDAVAILGIVAFWSCVTWRNWPTDWRNLATFAVAWFVLTITYELLGQVDVREVIGPILCVATAIAIRQIRGVSGRP